ncbi:MAG TPA: hypothetical protein VLZ76_05360 [Lysobacter sp.]|nr:hypothetical protein [Lysobacter sp.]
MTHRHAYRLALPLLCLSWLAACANPSSSHDAMTAGLNQASEEIRSASDKVREELAHGDISLSSDDANAPDAAITPQGELLIDGHKVATDAAQQALLLDYRTQIAGIAQAGADIGLQGADLAMKAMGEAVKGVFNGASEDDIKRAVEAQASGIKQEAMKLCDRLPALLATQQKLAAALPEFQPYATMDQSEIDDCRNNDGFTDADRAQTQAEVRDKVRNATRTGIRDGIRGSIQRVAQAAGIASAGTGDTVEINGVRFLLPPGGVSTEAANDVTRIEVSNGLRVKLVDGELWINGKRYPAPKAGGEIDLRTPDTVKVDGAVVSTI